MDKIQLQKLLNAVKESKQIKYQNLKPRGYKNTCATEVVYVPTNNVLTQDKELQPLITSFQKLTLNPN